MRLTALVDGPNHVCCRYRVAAFRESLADAGHVLDLCPWPRSWWGRLTLHRTLGDADAVLVQRKLLPRWQLTLLRRSIRRLIFDLDDAVFLRDSYSAKGSHDPRRLRRFAAVCRAADVVVAGNTFLASAAAKHARADHVHVVPTCVDPDRYPVATHASSDVELVWVGSSSTLRGLEAVRPLLEELGRRVPGLRLKLVCDRFLTLDHLAVVPCPWSEATEPAAIAASDVGISWVPDDDWSRGKCGLKVLQYMAAGLPVVANPVGVQAEMVRHGETGFLATTADEWCAAVRTLAENPELRRRMGEAGRRRVEDEFSVRTGAARWLALLASLQRKGAA
jgi:glycosyltransferase involved in cell wall biosynthesis